MMPILSPRPSLWIRSLAAAAMGLLLFAGASFAGDSAAEFTDAVLVHSGWTFALADPSEVSPEAALPDGPFAFSQDHQCAESGAGFCCQLDDQCRRADGEPTNGGPYYARDEAAGNNDLVRVNFYWTEQIPADLSDAECRDYVVHNSAALIPRLHPEEALFLLKQQPGSFGDLCGYRGETVRFCRSLAFLPRKSIEDEFIPWAFTVDAPRAPPMFGELDSPGLDMSAESSCSP